MKKVDFEGLLATLVSLTILVFVLAGMRKVIMYLAGQWGLTGISSFLA